MQKNSSPKLSSALHPCEVPHLVGAELIQLHFITHYVMNIKDNDHSSAASTPAHLYGSPYLSRETPHHKSVERNGSAQLHAALTHDKIPKHLS